MREKEDKKKKNRNSKTAEKVEMLNFMGLSLMVTTDSHRIY